MSENKVKLKPCPFCGGEAVEQVGSFFWISCQQCGAESEVFFEMEGAIEAWNKRSENSIVKVETSFFDKEEIHENCTVQVLTNTATGEVSVGWWKNGGVDNG